MHSLDADTKFRPLPLWIKNLFSRKKSQTLDQEYEPTKNLKLPTSTNPTMSIPIVCSNIMISQSDKKTLDFNSQSASLHLDELEQFRGPKLGLKNLSIQSSEQKTLPSIEKSPFKTMRLTKSPIKKFLKPLPQNMVSNLQPQDQEHENIKLEQQSEKSISILTNQDSHKLATQQPKRVLKIQNQSKNEILPPSKKTKNLHIDIHFK